MAGPELKNRLWITEFDVENEDIDFRTEDVKFGFQYISGKNKYEP